MDETTKATKEEASYITTMVVAALQSDPETAICEKVSDLTNQAAFNNKVYLKLTTGEVFRFTIAPTRSRS